MARFVAGDVVVVPFPFSDLSRAKRRPALVIKPLQGDDVILCQITSQAKADPYAIPLDAGDFATGQLKHKSNIRPNRLFTCDGKIILYTVGSVTAAKNQEVIQAVIKPYAEVKGSHLMAGGRHDHRTKGGGKTAALARLQAARGAGLRGILGGRGNLPVDRSRKILCGIG